MRLHEWISLAVSRLIVDSFTGRAWHGRRIIASRDVIVFSKIEDTEEEHVIDAIPLFEIDYICSAQSGDQAVQDVFNPSQKRFENDKKADSQNETFKNSFQIRTLMDGYNSGRAYYLKASSEEECAEIVEKLAKSARAAKKSREAKTRFEQSQERVRTIYRSDLCQGFTATMIVAVLPRRSQRLLTAPHECWPHAACDFSRAGCPQPYPRRATT
jgi:hypothetical protein